MQADAHPCGGSALDAQKKRAKPRRISLLADRHFLLEYKALNSIKKGISPVQSGVSAIVGVLKGDEPSGPLPAFMTKAPSPWRYLTDEVQGHFAFEALQALGPVVAFTAWCSTEISERAYATGKPLLWLRKRVVEALGAAFGPVALLATIEEEWKDGKLRLHLHGALGLACTSRRSLVRLRQALRRAMGPWTGPAAKFQIKFRLDVDCGWASYCTKRSWLALPGIRDRFACARPGSPWRLSFDGPTLTMTNGIRALAKELHQKAREAVQEARQRAPAPAEPEAPSAPLEPVCEPVKLPLTRVSIPINRLVLPDPAGQSQLSATPRSRGPPDRGGPTRMCQIACQDGVSRNRRSARHPECLALAVPGFPSSRRFPPRTDRLPARRALGSRAQSALRREGGGVLSRVGSAR